MSYRVISGSEGNIRPVVKHRLAAVRKLLEDPADLRKWLNSDQFNSLYAITGDGPIVSFITCFLPRGGINATLLRESIQVTDFMSPGYPVVELDLPGWVRRFNDRWWEIRDAAVNGYPPELDDVQHMPVESVLAVLNAIGA